MAPPTRQSWCSRSHSRSRVHTRSYDARGHLSNVGPLPVLAVLGGTRYAVLADHLHTPRRLMQSQLLTNWQWPFSAFGEEPPTQRKYRFANPATVNLGQTTTANPLNYHLRFPGQVADAESGLFYNYYRTYQPNQGRYTQFDPIGLGGGWNRFGYVNQNSLSFTDPDGLQIIRPRPIGPIPGLPGPVLVDPFEPGGPTYSPAQPLLPNWFTDLFKKESPRDDGQSGSKSCKLISGIRLGDAPDCRHKMQCTYQCSDGTVFTNVLNWKVDKCPDYWLRP
jgi:RHS repeat-associated protein